MNQNSDRHDRVVYRLVFKRRGFADKADDSADGTGAIVKKR